MRVSDLIKNTLTAAAVGAVSVGAVAVGTVLSRRSELADRTRRTVSDGAQRIGDALARTGSELGALWSDIGSEIEQQLRAANVGGRRHRAARRDPSDAEVRADQAPAEPAAPPRRKRKAAAADAPARPKKAAPGKRATAAAGSNGHDRRRNSRSRPN